MRIILDQHDFPSLEGAREQTGVVKIHVEGFMKVPHESKLSHLL